MFEHRIRELKWTTFDNVILHSSFADIHADVSAPVTSTVQFPSHLTVYDLLQFVTAQNIALATMQSGLSGRFNVTSHLTMHTDSRSINATVDLWSNSSDRRTGLVLKTSNA
jgi:hypothetical protein